MPLKKTIAALTMPTISLINSRDYMFNNLYCERKADGCYANVM